MNGLYAVLVLVLRLLLWSLSFEGALERSEFISEERMGLIGYAGVRLMQGVLQCTNAIGKDGDFVMENFSVGEDEAEKR